MAWPKKKFPTILALGLWHMHNNILNKVLDFTLHYSFKWGASQILFFFVLLQWANLIGPSLKKKNNNKKLWCYWELFGEPVRNLGTLFLKLAATIFSLA